MHRPSAEEFLLTLLETVDDLPPDLAQRFRYRADLLDARLVDPLWRAFTARALQIAA